MLDQSRSGAGLDLGQLGEVAEGGFVGFLEALFVDDDRLAQQCPVRAAVEDPGPDRGDQVADDPARDRDAGDFPRQAGEALPRFGVEHRPHRRPVEVHRAAVLGVGADELDEVRLVEDPNLFVDAVEVFVEQLGEFPRARLAITEDHHDPVAQRVRQRFEQRRVCGGGGPVVLEVRRRGH